MLATILFGLAAVAAICTIGGVALLAYGSPEEGDAHLESEPRVE